VLGQPYVFELEFMNTFPLCNTLTDLHPQNESLPLSLGVTEIVKDAGTVSLLGVHRHSGMEWGLDGKDLASAYVLRPLDWWVLIFQSWAELTT
jgi:hypothetical protein